MGTHPIFESDFDCLTDCRCRYSALCDQPQPPRSDEASPSRLSSTLPLRPLHSDVMTSWPPGMSTSTTPTATTTTTDSARSIFSPTISSSIPSSIRLCSTLADDLTTPRLHAHAGAHPTEVRRPRRRLRLGHARTGAHSRRPRHSNRRRYEPPHRRNCAL